MKYYLDTNVDVLIWIFLFGLLFCQFNRGSVSEHIIVVIILHKTVSEDKQYVKPKAHRSNSKEAGRDPLVPTKVGHGTAAAATKQDKRTGAESTAFVNL